MAGAIGQRPSAGAPHDASGHTWHHGDFYLFAVTKYGIERLLGQHYPNAMPIYDGVLSDREIIAVLSYIKSQWPAEIQSRHDRLNQQLRRQNNWLARDASPAVVIWRCADCNQCGPEFRDAILGGMTVHPKPLKRVLRSSEQVLLVFCLAVRIDAPGSLKKALF